VPDTAVQEKATDPAVLEAPSAGLTRLGVPGAVQLVPVIVRLRALDEGLPHALLASTCHDRAPGPREAEQLVPVVLQSVVPKAFLTA